MHIIWKTYAQGILRSSPNLCERIFASAINAIELHSCDGLVNNTCKFNDCMNSKNVMQGKNSEVYF